MNARGDMDDAAAAVAAAHLANPPPQPPPPPLLSTARRRPTLEIAPPVVPLGVTLGDQQLAPSGTGAAFNFGLGVAHSGASEVSVCRLASSREGGAVQEHELNQIRHLLEAFRDRHRGVLGRCSALEQDLTAVHAQLSNSEAVLQEERNACSRLGLACKQLQAHVAVLIAKLGGFTDFKRALQSKVESVEELVQSLSGLKSEEHSKAVVCNDPSLERAMLEDKIMRLEGSLARQRTEAEQAAKAIEERDVELASSRTLSQDLAGQVSKLEDCIREAEASYRETLLKFDGEFGEYKRGVQDLITMLSRELSCHPPESFGNGGIEALRVVLRELCTEHCQHDRQKDCEFQEQREALTQSTQECQQKLAIAEEQVGNLLGECKTLHDRVDELTAQASLKDQHIKRIEQRISEQQLESSGMTAKLAQLQRLGVVGALLNDVFEQQASSMEYEDMKLLLEEKLGHHACAAEIARLKETIDRGAAERATMTERLEALQGELEAERKLGMGAATGSKGVGGRGDRSKSRLATSNASKGLPTGGKREGMDELIELIEKDTQELQGKKVDLVTPPSTVRRSGPRSSASGNSSKFRRRSPVSAHSELDLWAAFAKR